MNAIVELNHRIVSTELFNAGHNGLNIFRDTGSLPRTFYRNASNFGQNRGRKCHNTIRGRNQTNEFLGGLE